jgi:hypothetical protein
MLHSLYEKTKTWGPGSCMVAFYFFSLIPLSIILLLGTHLPNIHLRSIVISDIDLFIHSLLVAPWFETLLIQVLVTKVFSIMKCRPTNIIIAVTVVFSMYHLSNGWIYPLVLLIPGLMFTWNYFLYYEKNEAVWGFLSTSVLHFLYNFTIFVIVPMINIVLTIYYETDALN